MSEAVAPKLWVAALLEDPDDGKRTRVIVFYNRDSKGDLVKFSDVRGEWFICLARGAATPERALTLLEVARDREMLTAWACETETEEGIGHG